MDDNRYKFIISTIQKAGELLLEATENFFEISSKNNDFRDIVTNVDIEINNFISDKINESFPDEIIYSEETPLIDTSSGSFWSIDPIDGTSNFARHIPHFAVVLAYIENGEAVCGAILNPITKELFSFNKNQGAFLNGKSIHVSQVNSLKDAYILLHIGRKEEIREWGLGLQKTFLAQAKKNINLGSSALDLAFLAANRVDAVIYGTMTTMDVSVALALVRFAGGEIYDLGGVPIKLSKIPQQIIATSTKELFEEIKKVMK